MLNTYSEIENERKFLNNIISEDYDAALKILEKTIKNMELGSSYALQLNKCKMLGFVNTLINTLGNSKSKEDMKFIEGLDPVGRLVGSESLKELYEQIYFVFNSFCEYYKVRKKDKEQLRVEAVISYIYENISDQTLNVTRMIEKFNVSYSLIARSFKKHTGMGILDYLHKTRIEKAKELISETDMNLREIGIEAGYTNVVTLIRDFRKYEGVSPGKYRKNHI